MVNVMSSTQRKILGRYLTDENIEITYLGFVGGGQVSKGDLSIRYNLGNRQYTDVLDADGNTVETRHVELAR